MGLTSFDICNLIILVLDLVRTTVMDMKIA